MKASINVETILARACRAHLRRVIATAKDAEIIAALVKPCEVKPRQSTASRAA
jgi:hypothetical protein